MHPPQASYDCSFSFTPELVSQKQQQLNQVILRYHFSFTQTEAISIKLWVSLISHFLNSDYLCPNINPAVQRRQEGMGQLLLTCTKADFNSLIICHITRFLLNLLVREYASLLTSVFFNLSPLSNKMIYRISLSLYSNWKQLANCSCTLIGRSDNEYCYVKKEIDLRKTKRNN